MASELNINTPPRNGPKPTNLGLTNLIAIGTVGFPEPILNALRQYMDTQSGISLRTFHSTHTLASQIEHYPDELAIVCVYDSLSLLKQLNSYRTCCIGILSGDTRNGTLDWLNEGASAVYGLLNFKIAELAEILIAHARKEQVCRKSRQTQSPREEAAFSWDNHHKINHWNTKAETLLGWNRNTVIGKSVGSWLFPEKDIHLYTSNATRWTNSSLGDFKAICRIRQYDGSLLRVQLQVHSQKDSHGENVGFFATCQPQALASEVFNGRVSGKNQDRPHFFDTGEESIWDHNLADNTVYWSSNIYRRLGISPATADSKALRFLKRIHRDDRSHVRKAYRDCMLGHSNRFSLIYRMQDSQGVWRYFQSNAKVDSRDSNGTVQRIVGTDIDITRYINSAEELKFSKHTLDYSTNGVIWVNHLGKIVYSNRKIQQLLRHEAYELNALSLQDIDPELSPPPHGSTIPRSRALKTKRLEYKRKDGSTIDIEIDCKYIDANNECVLVIFIRDISQRKQYERELSELNKSLENRVQERTEQLEQANKRLQTEIEQKAIAQSKAHQHEAFLSRLLEKLPVGVYAKETKAQGHITIWNAEMERMLQLPKEDVIGKTFEEVFSNKKLSEALGNIVGVEQHKRAIIPKINPPSGSDDSFIADITKAPIRSESNDLIALVGIIHDVTDRIQSEGKLIEAFNELEGSKRALEQSNLEIRRGIEKAKKLAIDAQASNKAKSYFLSSISHELRTPLNSIVGLTHVIMEETFGPLNEKQSELLHIMEESGKHLQSLITDVLDLSKIELGKLQLNLTNTCPVSVAEASLKMVSQQASSKQVFCQLEVEPDLEEAHADPKRLRQILLNLLGNAVKFTRPNTTVTLKIQNSDDKETVMFSIYDQGIGIRQEDTDKLFKPFTQVDSRLARQYEGTGLGLAIVSKLVELHGGNVSVSSAPQRGSVFSVALPTSLPASNNHDDSYRLSFYDLSHQPHKQEGVAIIVEENPSIAKRTYQTIRACGYQDVVIAMPNEISADAQRIRPALVIADLSTLRNQGSEWVQACKAMPAWKTARWIAMTSQMIESESQLAKQLKFHELIPKPLTRAHLIDYGAPLSSTYPITD